MKKHKDALGGSAHNWRRRNLIGRRLLWAEPDLYFLFQLLPSQTHKHTETNCRFLRVPGGTGRRRSGASQLFTATCHRFTAYFPKQIIRGQFTCFFVPNRPAQIKNRARQEKLRPPLPVCRTPLTPAAAGVRRARLPITPPAGAVTFRRECLCCVDVSAAAGLEEGLLLAPEEQRRISRRGREDGGATVMFSFNVNLVCLLLDLVVFSITSALG